MASRHWWYMGGFVLTAVLLVGTGLMGVFDALSVLSGGYYGEFILLAMLYEAAEWVIATVMLGLLSIVFLFAAVVSVLRNASLPRDDRLVSLVERLEREYPVLQEFDASEKFEPTVQERRETLKEQYVNGEISEQEFEREMEGLLDETETDERSASEYTAVDIEKN